MNDRQDCHRRKYATDPRVRALARIEEAFDYQRFAGAWMARPHAGPDAGTRTAWADSQRTCFQAIVDARLVLAALDAA